MAISLMLSGNGNYDSKRISELSKDAEKSGLDCLWFGETTLRDASVLAAVAAVATEKIKLGTSVVNIFTRSPGQLAMMGETINELSSGRFTLGLGVSSVPIVQGWHGINFNEPIPRIEEVALLVRSYFSGERFSKDGKFVSPRNARLRIGPPPKLALAALGDQMILRASRLADKIILNFRPADGIKDIRSKVSEYVSTLGMEKPQLSVMLYFVLNEGDQTGIEVARELINFYMYSDSYRKLFARLGFSSEVNAASGANAKGDTREARKSISENMIEKLLVVGDMKKLMDRANVCLQQGADEILVVPSPFGSYENYIKHIVAEYRSKSNEGNNNA